MDWLVHVCSGRKADQNEQNRLLHVFHHSPHTYAPPPECIATEALDHTLQQASRNPNVILVMTPTGGHIGWGEGLFLHLFRASWAERLTVDFIDACKLVQERGGIGGLGGGGGGLAPPRARL